MKQQPDHRKACKQNHVRKCYFTEQQHAVVLASIKADEDILVQQYNFCKIHDNFAVENWATKS